MDELLTGAIEKAQTFFTEEQWNKINLIVCFRSPERAFRTGIALFCFGALAENEIDEGNVYLEDMGFDLEDVPMGITVWEGTWEADPPDHEGVSDNSSPVGKFRAPTKEELACVIRGEIPWKGKE